MGPLPNGTTFQRCGFIDTTHKQRDFLKQIAGGWLECDPGKNGGHLPKGCLHSRYSFLQTQEPANEEYRSPAYLSTRMSSSAGASSGGTGPARIEKRLFLIQTKDDVEMDDHLECSIGDRYYASKAFRSSETRWQANGASAASRLSSRQTGKAFLGKVLVVFRRLLKTSNWKRNLVPDSGIKQMSVLRYYGNPVSDPSTKPGLPHACLPVLSS
jgi:hypothetical protein